MRGGENVPANGANGVSTRTRSKTKGAGSAPGTGGGAAAAARAPTISEQAARVQAARSQAAVAGRAAQQQARAAAGKAAPSGAASDNAPANPASPQAPPTADQHPEPEVDEEVALRAAQALRIEQESACVGQMRVVCGAVDDLPPGDLRFMLTMQMLAPLWLPGCAEIACVDDAHAALAALLEQGSSNKLSPAEETPVARKALLRYLQTCM